MCDNEGIVPHLKQLGTLMMSIWCLDSRSHDLSIVMKS